MHIAFAPIKLKDGVSESDFLKISEAFETAFVKKQKGILKRILVKDTNGNYADIVFFEDMDAIQRVIEAEKISPEVARFFEVIREDSGEHQVFEVLKTYE